VVTIILLLFGTTALAQNFVIPSGSMEGTLLIGDHLLVDKLSYAPAGSVSAHLLPYQEPRHGDIIVFRSPADLTLTLVKRVVGIPGDRIRLVNKQVVRNGEELYEPYTIYKTDFIDPYRDNFPAMPNAQVLPRGLDMLERNVVDGEVVVRRRMSATLSADHRALDGADAARFLSTFKTLLQDPGDLDG